MKRKTLVTGATGFVGSNLVRGLITDGWGVAVLVRESSDLDAISDLIQLIEIYRFDGKIDTMVAIFSEYRPDVVFHVASLFLANHHTDQIESLVESNILFGVQLVEGMAETGVKCLVNTSTSWEYYDNGKYNPVNLYAATKRAFLDVLEYYIEAKNVRAITLRLCDTYGPNDQRPKLLNLLKRIAGTDEVIALSPGWQKIDMVHIDDVINGYILSAHRLLNSEVIGHEIYKLSSDNPISIRELVGLLERRIGKSINVEWGARTYRDREVMEPWEGGESLPGFETVVSLEAGIV
jgi:nucleoside-diphosphate-sugar epimerase